MSRKPLNVELWRGEQFLRGYRVDFERSRNQEGTVPTREAHLWCFEQADSLRRGIGTVHAVCGELELHWGGDHRLSQSPDDPKCADCLDWLLDRQAHGYTQPGGCEEDAA